MKISIMNIYYLFGVVLVTQCRELSCFDHKHGYVGQNFENRRPTLTTEAEVETCNITTIISKASGEITSMNYPDPYPTNCQWTYMVHVGTGHYIQVKVTHFDVNVDEGDLLTIEPSTNGETSMKNDITSVSNKMNSSNNETFEISTECCDSAIIKFIVGNHSNNHSGFSLIFQRIEKLDPDNIITILPGWHQIYLCGTCTSEFLAIEETFKHFLSKIIVEYCIMHNLLPSSQNTTNFGMVTINGILPCPSSWPLASKCIQVNFSSELVNNHSELTSTHLAEMWQLHRNKQKLDEIGLWEYEIPDVEWFFWFWIALICFLSVFFCILLIIAVKTKLINYYMAKLKMPKSNDEMRANLMKWTDQQKTLVYPYFTTENSNRFRFLAEYERMAQKPVPCTSNLTSGLTNEAYVGSKQRSSVPEIVVNDFDSEDDDQHIYSSLD